MAGFDMTLAERTLELVNVPSESLEEEELAELVLAAVPLELVHRHESTLMFVAPREGRPHVVLAGHLDTVPAQGNIPGRIEDGAVHGLGASDMKGGLAVMIELARWIADARPELAADVSFLFFPREELPAEQSALPKLFDTGRLDTAKLVIMLEPTDNAIQAGCLGHLSGRIAFHGTSGHSARPWLADNAIDRAVEALAGIVGRPPREVEIDGLVFREVLTVTEIHGGIAGNVIPDRVDCTVSFRYAPDRTPAEAEAELRRLIGDTATLEEFGNSPAGRVVADTPLVMSLRDAGGFAIEPKQAWTPVAEFTERGLDAVNLGPGAPRFAHRRDEQVAIAQLQRSFDALRRFLSG